MRSGSLTILYHSAVLGAIGLVAGTLLPALTSDSNLLPLIGIFLSGPAGMLAGGFLGLARSIRVGHEWSKAACITALGTGWVLTLAYTLFLYRLAPRMAIAGVLVQVVAALVTLSVIWSDEIDPGSPELVRYWVVKVLATAAVVSMIAVSLFPPIRPRFPRQQGTYHTAAGLFDPRLDGRRHVSPMVVNGGLLCVEWAAAGVLCLLYAAGFYRCSEQRDAPNNQNDRVP